jgi:hypothetical protein
VAGARDESSVCRHDFPTQDYRGSESGNELSREQNGNEHASLWQLRFCPLADKKTLGGVQCGDARAVRI